jgi:hypothetical protein
MTEHVPMLPPHSWLPQGGTGSKTSHFFAILDIGPPTAAQRFLRCPLNGSSKTSITSAFSKESASSSESVPSRKRRRTYRRCFDNEKEATSTLPGTTTTPLIYARFLGYLLLELPTNEGRRVLGHEILECVSDNLDIWGKRYVDHLIRLCVLSIFKTLLLSWYIFEFHVPFFSP